MKKGITLLFLFIFFAPTRCLFIEFDSSMKLIEHRHVVEKSLTFTTWYSFFKSLYENNIVFLQNEVAKLRIPKTLHFIWLGGVMPNKYKKYQESWYEIHPNWQIVWWTDTPDQFDADSICNSFDDVKNNTDRFIVVDTRNLIFDNKQYYDAAANYGEKSDILRWEIVYRCGGVYLDIDFEAIKPIDSLNYCFDFYTGMQPLDTNMVQLGAGLCAARPGHPILRECIDAIQHNQHIQQIILKTGPLHFTKSCSNALQKYPAECGRCIALPASFLYPCGYNQRGLPQQVWIRPESFAVHQWAGSWLRPEAFDR